MVAAPAASRAAVRESRRAIRARARAAGGAVRRLLEGRARRRRRWAAGAGGRLQPGDAARPGPRAAPVPIDLSRPLEELLGGVELRHRPRPRSVRAQRGLGRASPLALAQRRQLPRADASASSPPRWRGPWSRSSSAGSTPARSSCRTTSELMERFFPGTYELVAPGADRGVEGWWPRRRDRDRSRRRTERPVRIAFCLEEERGALRLFLRALRRLPLGLRLGGGGLAPGRRPRSASRAGCATGSTPSARARRRPRS